VVEVELGERRDEVVERERQLVDDTVGAEAHPRICHALIEADLSLRRP
jgi:hypothetical protein